MKIQTKPLETTVLVNLFGLINEICDPLQIRASGGDGAHRRPVGWRAPVMLSVPYESELGSRSQFR